MGLVSTSAASGEEVTSGCSAGSAHRGQLSGRRLSPRRGHRSVPQGGWVQSSALSAVWSPRGSFPSNSILRAPLTAPGHLPLPPACPPPRFLLRVPPPPQELRKKMQKTLLETCFIKQGKLSANWDELVTLTSGIRPDLISHWRKELGKSLEITVQETRAGSLSTKQTGSTDRSQRFTC